MLLKKVLSELNLQGDHVPKVQDLQKAEESKSGTSFSLSFRHLYVKNGP